MTGVVEGVALSKSLFTMSTPPEGITQDIEKVTDTDHRDGGPLPMKFFSTWEVRKVQPNCVSRSCTLTITRLEILQSIEPGLQSVVLSVSMKTPHRSLRSNELEVPINGIMNISLNLTFSLEYPHFLKRGGNDLQIRLQRRKRYRNRTIRGYKTLARGEVNMGLVLQKSFQGVVKLFTEKNSEPVATVTVGSLTSTPAADFEAHQTADGASSDEEDEIIFSDDRGTDSDSLDENIDPSNYEVEAAQTPKISLKQPSSVLRLLRLRALGGQGRTRVPVEVTLGLAEEEGEGIESIATSLSDSYDEEETLSHGQTTPRPKLRPFFGSDTLSLISMPQPGEIDGTVEGTVQKYGSLELAITHGRTRSHSPSEVLEPLDMPESALIKGRLWLVQDNDALQNTLQSLGEPLLATPTQCTSSSLLSLFNTLHNLWHKTEPFLLMLAGDCSLLSAILRAYITRVSFPFWIFLWSDMEKKASPRPSPQTTDDKLKDTHQSIIKLLGNLNKHLVYRPLPLAQAELSTETTSRYVPFVYNVVMGPWETDTDLGHHQAPSSPTSENYELLLEYWGGKKDSQKSSVKVRSVMVTVVAGPLLNITAIIRKRGIRIRRPKDATGEGSIMSVTASHLSCRNTKNDVITGVVDGVEWLSLVNVKLSAQWEYTATSFFPRATCHTPSDLTPPSTESNLTNM